MTLPDVPPPGRVLAHYELAHPVVSFVARPTGEFVLRFAGVGDFVVDGDLSKVVVHAEPGTDPALVSVFATGAVPSFVLLVKGEPLLHASAVAFGDRAVAFVGPSGTGKSTVATLCCAAGGRLITDDVLRLSPGTSPRCYLGAAEVRLRTASEEPAGAFPGPPVGAPHRRWPGRPSATAGGRRTASPGRHSRSRADRQASVPAVQRLSAVDALVGLISFPRLMGWRDPVTQAQQFQLMGDVAANVPVFTANIPGDRRSRPIWSWLSSRPSMSTDWSSRMTRRPPAAVRVFR